MKDKNFYISCLEALKVLCQNGTLPEKECKRITGVYYKEVVAEFIEKEAAYNIGYGEYEKDDNAEYLLETEYYERKIKEIEDDEYRTELDNRSKIATIKGTRIAKWALWLSILSLTGMVQDLIAWIGTFIKQAVKDFF